MFLPLAFELCTLVLGLLFGSFLNVCISRLPKHQSLSRPRSHCPHCLAAIPWYDNIPLLSWLLLRARCRNCKMPISWRYPAVELAVGLWFFISLNSYVGARFNAFYFPQQHATGALADGLQAFVLLMLGFLLLGLLVMDWQTRLLPDAFTFTGIFLGFILTCCQALFLAPGQLDINVDTQRQLRLRSPGSFVAKGTLFMTGPEHLVLGRILAIIAAAGLILLIRALYKKLRHREGLGVGDAKLLGMIAAFLGFWPAVLAFFFGILFCSAYALTLLARGRATATTRLPLGTFLCIGGLLSALIGTSVIAWYSTLL